MRWFVDTEEASIRLQLPGASMAQTRKNKVDEKLK
jgi:hypothetical protein